MKYTTRSNTISRSRIMVVFGTRPEFIKLAPLISKLRSTINEPSRISVVDTGQHPDLLEIFSSSFNINIDHKLFAFKRDQTLASSVSNLLSALDKLYQEAKPNLVIVHGDTNSSLCGALAAFYNGIKIIHIEAGLRSENKLSPHPEEMNRILISQLADYHFCVSEHSLINLSKEGITKNVFVVGNTITDSLKFILAENKCSPPHISALKDCILVTCHRRENKQYLTELLEALQWLAKTYPTEKFVFIKHPSTMMHLLKFPKLQSLENFVFTNPLTYPDFVCLMKGSKIILTDSGGIQEEASILRKEVLVLRQVTERKELMTYGALKLIDCRYQDIIDSVIRSILNPQLLPDRAKIDELYTNTTPTSDIVDIIKDILNREQ